MKHRRQGASVRMMAMPAAFVALLATLATCAAAAVPGTATAVGAVSATLTLRLNQDWISLDPYVDASFPQNWTAVGPLYDRLVSVSPKGKGYVPYLATSWTQKAKSVTFKVRRDAKCSDGHVLTVLDMLNSVKRWITVPKRTGSVAVSSLGGWGAGPYHLHANLKKATLTLSVDSPYRGLLRPFASLPIICPSGLAAVAANPRALETAAFGSGPYTLVSATHGDHIEYKLRPDWRWGPPGTSTASMPETVVYKVVTDETTAANLLLTGGINVGVFSGPDVDRLLADKSLTHVTIPNYIVWDLDFNQRPGAFFTDQPKLRQAIMMAVDRNAFNVAAQSGRGTISLSNFRPDSECYDSKIAPLVPKLNLAAAKQLLQSIGYTYRSDGKLLKDGRTVGVTLLSSILFNAGGEYIASVLSQLGFEVTLHNFPSTGYGPDYLRGNFDLTIARGSVTDPEPGSGQLARQGPFSGSNSAYIGGGDPVLQRYFNAAMQNLNCKYFHLWQEEIAKNYYSMPLVAANFDLFARGWTVPPLDPSGPTDPIYFMKQSR